MNTTDSNKTEGETSRQYVYRILKGEIMSWKRLPGELLNDTQISAQLGVSRTPVREALFMLKEDRLVTIYARNKTVVSLIDWSLIEEGKFVRTALETLVASELCGNIPADVIGELSENLALQRNLAEGNCGRTSFFDLDNEFHHILYRASGKEHTYKMVRRMCYQVDRVRYYMIPRANLIQNMMRSHQSILKYITDGDRDKLTAVLTQHINDVFDSDGKPATFAVGLFKTHPEYFSNAPSCL
ncbi:MAG: GntR family transcriptional regulator [Candidatus Heteroscillospira sp.]|jgi:DNA-binding GntR family transcriptional regulator